MMRLFIAVWPPPEVVDVIAAMPRPENPALRWTTPDQWHVTLRFLGSVDDTGYAELRARLDACVFPGPAHAELGPEIGRFGQNVLQVPVSGLDRHAQAVTAATEDLGESPSDAFVGHLTLARVRGRARFHLRPYCGTPISAAWEADEVTIVRSRTAPQGGQYEVLDRRSLHA